MSSFYDFYHRFFHDKHKGNTRPPEDNENGGFNKPGPPFCDGTNDDMRNFTPDIKIIMDQFEMNLHFGKTLNEMFKAFTFGEIFQGLNESDMFGSPNIPAVEENKSPRDQYLKSGLYKTPFSQDNFDQEHREMSKSLSPWFGGLLTSPKTQDSQDTSQPRVYSSFRSVIRRSVTLPDGTVKTEEIIRNSDGTEERTESHTVVDGHNTPNFDFKLNTPDVSVFFKEPKMPDINTIIPRDQFSTPGYENLFGEKVDKDLDKQILESGIENLPSFSKDPEINKPNQNFSFKSFSLRTLPNGVVETEEIIRSLDGTEKKTVSKTLPDGTSSTTEEALADPIKRPQLGIQADPSIALKGVKDFMELLFK